MLVLAAAGVAISSFYFRATPARSPVVRFALAPPEGTTFSASASFLAVSPDGRWIAFLASRPGQQSRLWVRQLDSLTANELAGTEGALGVFWSPDSRALAFFANGMLKKVGIFGGSPEVLCEGASRDSLSGSWHQNGVILFTHPRGIYRTSADGGLATPVTTVDATRGELAHVLPQFLPDGRHFLYMTRVSLGASFESWIVVRSLDAADDRRLLTTGSQAVVAGEDSLMFLRDGRLVVQPFDATRRQTSGDPVAVPGAEHVAFNSAGPRGMFSVSLNGVLAYRPRTLRELEWFDRRGNPLGSIAAAGDADPALSHDGRRVAISRYDASTATRSLWLLDLSRGAVASQLTSSSAWDACPVWSPDDSTIVLSRGAPKDPQLQQISVGATTDEHPVALPAKGCPLDWSRDGRYLLFSASPNTTAARPGALWVVPVATGGEPRQLDATQPLGPRGSRGTISPDGRWLAYESATSGRREIYVRPFPNGGASVPVSTDGGIEPQWRGDGRELFFIGADARLMAAPVSTEPAFRVSTAIALFATGLDPAGLPIDGRNQYLVVPDGQRFLINQPRRDAAASSVTVVVNWPAALSEHPVLVR
jgi:Tol biopolymer transport system component